MISGIPVSPGIAFGKAFFLHKEKIILNTNKISPKKIKEEIKKFTEAQLKTIKQINIIKQNTSKNFGKDKEDIFEGYIMILEDQEFTNEILNLIKIQLLSADLATSKIIEKQAKTLETLDDVYLKNRAIDIRDIGRRLIENILKIQCAQINTIKEKIILIANDITPSETAQMNLNQILGFATDLGGFTSHTSIMARTLEIPAIVGTTNISKKIKNGDFIILDSLNNEIHVNPSESMINQKKLLKLKFVNEKNRLKNSSHLPALTIDNRKIEIGANIGHPDDIKKILNNGAECIGLYRTEFLFMSRTSLPSEEEQFQAYKTVAEIMKGKPVIIRTMDIGGDKKIPYMNLPKEDNPFLGWRAIRISMTRKEMLHTQLKAILRASVFGKLRIMFPMIISVEEIRILKLEITNIKEQLTQLNLKFDKFIEIGIMIETPAAAIMSQHLSKEVDFFSIGSNDLTQYTLAVDRGNDLVSNLYNPMSPSVLKLIKQVIDASHEKGKWTGICGELAADPNATKLLLGLGIDEFSMSSSAIPKIKQIIRNSHFAHCKKIAQQALSQATSKDLINIIHNNLI